MSQERFKAEILPIRNKLFHIAHKLMQEEEDAEDAVQEVLLKLWHTRETLGSYDNVAAFATTVTKNHCLDKLRVKKRIDSIDNLQNISESKDNPYLQLERRNTEETIRRIIEMLPPLQQTILRMKDMEEYEVNEIAEITGTKPEAIRVNLSRARKKVRETYIKWTTV